MPTISLPPVLALRAAGAFAVLLCAVGASVVLGSPAVAAAHSVAIEHYAYSPAALTIAAGDTVTWTNRDSVAHDVTVTAGPTTFHSPMLAQGQSWSHTFATPGSYGYVCSVHPDMHASVTVRAAAAPSSEPTRRATQGAAAASAPRTTPSASTAPTRRSAHAPRTTTQPTAAAAAPPAVSQEGVAPVGASAATLDPLLLVAGVSAAVTVFCLLLMTSRPVAREDVTG